VFVYSLFPLVRRTFPPPFFSLNFVTPSLIQGDELFLQGEAELLNPPFHQGTPRSSASCPTFLDSAFKVLPLLVGMHLLEFPERSPPPTCEIRLFFPRLPITVFPFYFVQNFRTLDNPKDGAQKRPGREPPPVPPPISEAFGTQNTFHPLFFSRE